MHTCLSNILLTAVLLVPGESNWLPFDWIRINVEKLLGPSRKTLERRAEERKAVLPAISCEEVLKDSTAQRSFDSVTAIDSPEISRQCMEADVRFLSDVFCSGRATGTAGYSASAFYVYRRFRECGLNTYISSYRANGKTGHNIMGEHCMKHATKWVIVMSRLDSVGDHLGMRFPGADANASGVAAMMRIAEKMQNTRTLRNVMFVALDGHHEGMSGASRLWDVLNEKGIGPGQIAMVINLDEIGSDLEPPVEGFRNYLIALGAESYLIRMRNCNKGINLNLYFDYYGSRNFTDLFYRRASDHVIFLKNEVPCVMFTSGITMDTNRPTDTPSKLNYHLLESRAEFIFRWLKTI